MIIPSHILCLSGFVCYFIIWDLVLFNGFLFLKFSKLSTLYPVLKTNLKGNILEKQKKKTNFKTWNQILFWEVNMLFLLSICLIVFNFSFVNNRQTPKKNSSV